MKHPIVFCQWIRRPLQCFAPAGLTFGLTRLEQGEVVTPGNNQKCHVVGSLHWRTAAPLLSAPGWQRNAALFLKHLDDQRERLWD